MDEKMIEISARAQKIAARHLFGTGLDRDVAELARIVAELALRQAQSTDVGGEGV